MAKKTVTTDKKKATRQTGGKRARKTKPTNDLAALRGPVEEAARRVVAAKKEAERLHAKARQVVADAKTAYRIALVPYRNACRKANQPCEFTGARAANVSERVLFIVEKVDKGLKVTVKGRPATERVIPKAKLKVSINKSAYDYCDEVLGPREEVGNKGGSLSSRLRAALKAGSHNSPILPA